MVFCVAISAMQLLSVTLHAETAKQVSQYGITWTFDKAYPVGKFVTGDYWVVGPVTVVSVNPGPGPAPAIEVNSGEKARYGASYFQENKDMRNGSVIPLKADEGQGFDSRLKNYKAELSVKFPCALKANESLLSTISNTAKTPLLIAELAGPKDQERALNTGAVLTCLDKVPPEDAFRPAYAGTDKTIYQTRNIQWNLLPKLSLPGKAPSWEQYERYLQRPWFENVQSWLHQYMGPSENQPNYGREFSRLVGIASLMLMLDVPQPRKEKLAIGMIQLGIDLHGLAVCGRQWDANGGHFSGRKWPILFAGLLLGDKGLQTLPSGTLFAEDQQTYFGKTWNGQPALFQMVFHTGVKYPYEEKNPATWATEDKFSESYRRVNSVGWVSNALAVQLMKAKQLWGHDAFFDYCDRYMNEDHSVHLDGHKGMKLAKSADGKESGTQDPFVDAMWAMHRKHVPEQPGSSQNLKWVWEEGAKGGLQGQAKGSFVANPKPQ